MAVEFLGLNLWDLLVNQIFGNYWLCIFGIGVIIFLIMGILGKMSAQTVTNYLLVYLIIFSVGYGYRWLGSLIAIILLIWMYNEIRLSQQG
jgi:hypothetical protein